MSRFRRRDAAETLGAPTAPFVRLGALWIQVTGTWCNLECTHCPNASGPTDPWLKPLAPAVVHRALGEAKQLGVREVYFTGASPFCTGRSCRCSRRAWRWRRPRC